MSEIYTPEINSLFQQLYLTKKDIDFIASFRDTDGCMFLHGSCLSQTHSNESDVDFSVITPSFTRYINQYLPDSIDPSIIDSMGVELKSNQGRELSFHLMRPSSREIYGKKGYSTKLRTTSPQNATLPTPAIDKNGVPLVINFGLTAEQITDSVFLMHIPQSGFAQVRHAYANVDNSDISFPILDIKRITSDNQLVPYDEAEHIFIWGTEANKALSDTPLSQVDANGYSQYVESPLLQSLASLKQFLPNDQLLFTIQEMLRAQALYRNIQAGRLRVDPEFQQSQIQQRIIPLLERIEM